MKLQQPFVLKIKWGRGGKGSREVSARHVEYIATRPGVALDQTREIEEGFDPTIHTKYMAERPRSLGLFGADLEHRPDLEAAMSEVRRTTGPTWRLILSLREDDAQALSIVGLPAWQDLTRRVMPTYAKALGVAEGDMCWVAAHHPEPGHPHVHVVAWLKEGVNRQALLSRQELRDVRRGVAKEMYGPLRAELMASKTAERDTLVAAGRGNIEAARRMDAYAQAVTPPAPDLAPRFRAPQLEALASRLHVLSTHVPGRGRMALAYMPEHVRDEARELADWVLGQPQMRRDLEGYLDAAASLTRLYAGQEAACTAARDRALSDLRDRVAQAVIREAASIQGERERMILRSMDPARAVAHVAGVTLSDEDATGFAALLRQVQVRDDGHGRLSITGTAAEAALATILQRTPAANRRKVEREIGYQARRLAASEREDTQWAGRAAAQRALGAAHSTLQREYRRAEAKAELARLQAEDEIEWEAERGEDR